VSGPLTATELADRLDETPANCSWHLRKLAEHAFVEEAGGGIGRQRPWRVRSIGLAWDRPRQDVLRGVALFAVVGLAGLGLYLGAVELGVNRFVVPAPPPDHWWTYPAVFMNAFGAAFLEEVVVLAYLVTRLRQLAWSPVAIILASALLRGSYHLYQGWGGFFGNLLMGALFAVLFLKWRRAWPFVITHVLLDAAAAIGWLAFRGHLPCI